MDTAAMSDTALLGASTRGRQRQSGQGTSVTCDGRRALAVHHPGKGLQQDYSII